MLIDPWRLKEGVIHLHRSATGGARGALPFGSENTTALIQKFLFEMILNTNNIFFHLHWQFLCKQKWQIVVG